MSDEVPGFYRASTLDASPLTFVRPERPAIPATPPHDRREVESLRADLAEALALLRDAWPTLFIDADLVASVAPDSAPARDAFARISRIDALLARHKEAAR